VHGWVKSYWDCWVLWPCCVFVVVESVFVRDCRGLEEYAVGRLG
jgi:hypothetical protein